MRIKRHDVPADVYTAAESIDAEGNSIQTWTKIYTVSADWQPLTAKSRLLGFGLDPSSVGVKSVYSDLAGDFPIGFVAVQGGKKYQCREIKEWYSHSEFVMVPWPGSLT